MRNTQLGNLSPGTWAYAPSKGMVVEVVGESYEGSNEVIVKAIPDGSEKCWPVYLEMITNFGNKKEVEMETKKSKIRLAVVVAIAAYETYRHRDEIKKLFAKVFNGLR